MPSFYGHTLSGAIGLAAGVLGAVAVGKAIQWWLLRNQGSSIEAQLGGRQDSNERRLELNHSFPFRSCRCAWVVHELGIENQVTFNHVKLHGADARDLMAYREVHPHGTLPSLVLEDSSVILESSAICLYLSECFLGPSGESLLPEPQNTAEYYNFICYATSTFDQILEPLYMQLTHTPEDQRNRSLVDSMRRKFTICANVLSTILSERSYVCGEKFTTADCVIGYNVWWASVIQDGALLADYPVLRSYLDRLKKRPAFEKTFVGYRKASGGSL